LRRSRIRGGGKEESRQRGEKAVRRRRGPSKKKKNSFSSEEEREKKIPSDHKETALHSVKIRTRTRSGEVLGRGRGP